ncbi:lipase 3-like isoform X1 [Andrena cerasifolii]|uniref:lipase 3-like isoform X1 n=1 Tax=Andrena cerasifolii TaxID=2819439 RepID=UPI0040376CE9
MLAIFSIFCCVATVTLGVPLEEENYKLSIHTRVAYDDSKFLTSAPNPQERAEKAGYTAETHEVVTEDGYILQMHRITGSKKSPKADNKPAVLLVHGLLDCSATWVLSSPEKGLGFLLSNWGYDVWMGNVRGTRYARKHKWMTTKDKEYWSFSWHEMGLYDLPAMIDYILATNKQQKILYAGHSQGSTAFFVMASERPEYQKKIAAMFALAPATFMSKSTSVLFKLLVPFRNDLKALTDLIGMYEFMPTGTFIQEVAKLACKDGGILQPLCSSVIFLIAGPGDVEFNKTLISDIVQYDPAGASTRQFVHYAQLMNSGNFEQYDHGIAGNLKKYGQIHPPKYNLGSVKIPVYLHYGSKDVFVNVKDLYQLYKALPNAQKFLVPATAFTHLDFVWSKRTDTLVYNKILSLMQRHRDGLA